MADIRSFIRAQLLDPLKQYPTILQDTMLEIIIDKLEELYEYTVKFPEIVSPNKYRIDILKTIAEQFVFTIREDADINEQIKILDHILYIYNRRGSVDTIENMWKYYGGELPKDIRVVIPSYNLFRYSISSFSGKHVYQDNTINRTGVYEVKLTNNTYPIPDLKKFMLKELVAAGNYIYFTNALHLDILDTLASTNPYKYEVDKETIMNLQLEVLKSNQGFTWSGINSLSSKAENSSWSGQAAIYMNIIHTTDIDLINLSTYTLFGDSIDVIPLTSLTILYHITTRYKYEKQIFNMLYCTPTDFSPFIVRYLYNSSGELVNKKYPGYFVLGDSLLGEEVI